MLRITEVLAGLEHRPESKMPAYEATITSAMAAERGIMASCGPAPEPATCDYCGSTLYYLGFVIPGDTPRIFHWSEQPQRCSCTDAAKRWAKKDAQAEQEKIAREAARDRAQHTRRVDELLTRSGLRKRFLQRTFDRFETNTPGRKRAHQIARNYAEDFKEIRERGEGLYIEGSNGTGKTHLAAAIALYLTDQEYSVIMKTSFDLLDEIKKAFDRAELSEHRIMQAYKECDLLVIDDLGKEQCTDWSMSILYSIMNERYEAMRPVIITTNFGDEDLIRILTPKNQGSHKIIAIISRLMEVSRKMTMAWEDYRGK